MMAAATGRLIDKLLAATDLKPKRHEIDLGMGEPIEVYMKPMTVHQRQQIMKAAKDDSTLFAMEALKALACDATGKPVFTEADMTVFRRQVSTKIADKIVALISAGDEQEDDLDLKSPEA